MKSNFMHISKLFLNIIYFILAMTFLYILFNYRKPVLYDLYNTLGGRAILILIALYGFTLNFYIGVALLIIIIGAKFLLRKETMVNPARPVVRRNEENVSGVDKLAVSETIRGKNSRNLANTSTSNSEDVEPFSSYNSMF